MFINCFNIYDKMQKNNKTKDTLCMKQINFIFTKNGFHIDETKEENTSKWAVSFKKQVIRNQIGSTKSWLQKL